MKLLFLNFILAAFFALSNTSSNPISPDGYYKGIKLCGRVQFVDIGEDFKVSVVSSLPDIRVKFTSFPSKVGEWRIVDVAPDFKVRVVESFPDFKIQIVNDFPGVK